MFFFIRFVIYVCVVVALSFGIMEFLVKHNQLELFWSVDKICLFHLALSLCVLYVINTIHKRLPKHTAYAFLGTSVVRMIAVIIFVLPLAKHSKETPIWEVFFLVIPYFILTAVEAIFTVKLIQIKK